MLGAWTSYMVFDDANAIKAIFTNMYVQIGFLCVGYTFKN